MTTIIITLACLACAIILCIIVAYITAKYINQQIHSHQYSIKRHIKSRKDQDSAFRAFMKIADCDDVTNGIYACSSDALVRFKNRDKIIDVMDRFVKYLELPLRPFWSNQLDSTGYTGRGRTISKERLKNVTIFNYVMSAPLFLKDYEMDNRIYLYGHDDGRYVDIFISTDPYRERAGSPFKIIGFGKCVGIYRSDHMLDGSIYTINNESFGFVYMRIKIEKLFLEPTESKMFMRIGIRQSNKEYCEAIECSPLPSKCCTCQYAIIDSVMDVDNPYSQIFKEDYVTNGKEFLGSVNREKRNRMEEYYE